MTRTSWLGCFTCGTDNRCDAMSLTKPNQELRPNLREIYAEELKAGRIKRNVEQRK